MNNLAHLTKIESAIANTILDWFFKNGMTITHMKIQKLFYFSVGYYWAKHDDKLIEHDFEAWPYGPVLPELLHMLKNYKDYPITRLILHEDGMPYLYKDGEISDVIIKTLRNLFDLSPWELSDMTHAEDGPWFQTVTKFQCYKKPIRHDLIRDYFKRPQEKNVF